MRTYGVNQAFRFVRSKESSNQNIFFGNYLFHACATYAELPSSIRTMTNTKVNKGKGIHGLFFDKSARWSVKSRYLNLTLYLTIFMYLLPLRNYNSTLSNALQCSNWRFLQDYFWLRYLAIYLPRPIYKIIISNLAHEKHVPSVQEVVTRFI